MKCIDGFWLPDSDTHFEYFASHPAGIAGYQQAQRDKAYTYVKDWSLAVDVGAHVGIFSRDFAKRFDYVLAFEPHSENFACLHKNLPENVERFDRALSHHDGWATTHVPTPHNSGSAVLWNFSPRPAPVTITKLDNYELNACGLIKADIQGGEKEFLLGAVDTIKRCKPVILIEEKGPQVEEAREIIMSLGYTRQEGIGIDRIYSYEEHKFGTSWAI